MRVIFYCNIMPSFSFGIIKRKTYFPQWVMFWNIGRIYFFFFSIQHNRWINFLNFSPTIFFWWVIYCFPVIFIWDDFILLFFAGLFCCLYNLTQQLQHIETICFFYWRGISLLFSFYPIRRIYAWRRVTRNFSGQGRFLKIGALQ